MRSKLTEALAAIGPAKELVLTSEDGVLARLAAPEAAHLCKLPVRVLAGGNEAWCAAGGEFESAHARWAVPARDAWLKPFDQTQGKVEDSLNAYLSWEVGLVEQFSRDGSLKFDFGAKRDGDAAHGGRATEK